MRIRLVQDEWSTDFSGAPLDVPVLLYHPLWVSEDFNPTGTAEGYWAQGTLWHDGEDYTGWVAALWDWVCDDWISTQVEPTHWMLKPHPPR